MSLSNPQLDLLGWSSSVQPNSWIHIETQNIIILFYSFVPFSSILSEFLQIWKIIFVCGLLFSTQAGINTWNSKIFFYFAVSILFLPSFKKLKSAFLQSSKRHYLTLCVFTLSNRKHSTFKNKITIFNCLCLTINPSPTVWTVCRIESFLQSFNICFFRSFKTKKLLNAIRR